MSWLRPIAGIESKVVIRRRTDGAVMPEPRYREVEIDGVRYPSMIAARKALGWSYSRIYRAIGENWRYAKRPG